MRKIKIGHIITRLDKGGSTENVLLTTLGLDKQRYNCTIIYGKSLNPESELIERAKKSGIKIIFVRQLQRSIEPVRDIIAFFRIWRVLIREKFDIVHTHSSKAGILGRWAALFAGIDVIFHAPHGHVFYGYFNKLFSYFIVFLERITACFTRRIVVLTQTGKSDHIKYRIGNSSKFSVIPSGIRLDRYDNFVINSDEKRKEFNISGEVPLIGGIGRFTAIKGYKYFVESASYVVQSLPNVHFLLAGEGSQKGELEELVKRLKLEGNFIFLNWIKDVREIFGILDVFVQPSLNEGMGKIIVKAMALGKPVIATSVGGIPDIVLDGRTGFLVPARDTRKMAQAIVELVRDVELRKRMGIAGRKRISSEFSSDTMVKNLSNLYEQELLSKKGSESFFEKK